VPVADVSILKIMEQKCGASRVKPTVYGFKVGAVLLSFIRDLIKSEAPIIQRCGDWPVFV
jgi:hypothetical protein